MSSSLLSLQPRKGLSKCLTLLVLLCASMTTAVAQSVDFRILDHLEEQRTLTMTGILSTTSNSLILAPAVPIVLMGGGWATDNSQCLHAGYVTGLSFLTAALLTEGMKNIVRRPRPYLGYPDDLHPVRTVHGFSFPSGHTSLTFATATALSLCYPKWYVIAPSMLWAAGVGFSRLYLGVHYPSDVLTGALVGTASAFFAYYLLRRQAQETEQPPAKFTIPVVIRF